MLPLTDEQLAAVDLFRKGDHLKIQALAGTGKTSTLIALASATPSSRGHYLAFNDAIASDASARFASNVSCSTTHSLAMNALRSVDSFDDAKLLRTPNVPMFESQTGSLTLEVPVEEKLDGSLPLSRRGVAALCSSTILNYVRSSDEEISAIHLPGKISGFPIKSWARNDVYNQISSLVQDCWAKMADVTNPFPLGHDGYLKLWALRRQSIPADFILLDEAQDTTDVVLGALLKQGIPVTYVGDSHQQIYDWRGAVNALDKAKCSLQCALTTSFRFGDQIAALGDRIAKGLGSLLTLKGFREGDSVTNQHVRTRAVLCKTNAGVVRELIDATSSGLRVHVIGGVAEIVRIFHEFERLESSQISDHSDLFGFKNIVEFHSFCSDFPELAGTTGSLYRLWREFRDKGLRQLLSSCHPIEKEAEVTISTVHRSKGLEWESVRLSDDFRPRTKQVWVGAPTRRLHYVAVTRACQLLSLPPDVHSYIQF